MFEFLNELVKEKKVLILGFGREGRSTYNVIKDMECKIGIADKNDVTFEGDVEFIIGDDYQRAIYDYDLVFKSPGIVLEDKSEAVLSKIVAQTDCMIKRYKNQIIGITGTKGKSTVTTLTYHILKNTAGNCILMGNIGIPAFDMLDEIDDNSILVYEFSCHQLEYSKYSPHIGVLLNIFPEHLDHYGTVEKYFASKMNVYLNQNEDDILICNIDNAPDKGYAEGNLVTVSLDKSADVSVENDCINDFGSLIPFNELESSLLGRHNMYNIAVCYNICKSYGVSLEEFKKHLKTYKPLPHRLEFAGEYDGVKYYDDSISTIGETTIQGLESLSDTGTLIIGGMDRGICYDQLLDFLADCRLDNIICMYDTGRILNEKLNNERYSDKNIVLVNDLKEAVMAAKKVTPKGKVCLMSPAAASYGFFKNFEERGDKFKEYIKGL